MDYKNLLLNRLLDKFEKSKAYLEEDTARRRVLVNLGAPEFPDYDIEKNDIRELINSIVLELQEKGLVGYTWLKHERGNIIDKVWLSLENISGVYREAARIPKGEKAEAILTQVRTCRERVTQGWIIDFLNDVEKALIAKKSPLPYLSLEPDQARAVLRALQAINDKGEAELLERVFSLRCFGDSKVFERQARKKVLEVIRRYLLNDMVGEGDHELTDEEILVQVGIVRNPEQVEFCGNLAGVLSGRSVDFSAFSYGAVLTLPTLERLEITSFPEVHRVLFIENKANYVEYIFRNKPDDTLAVYHGGFFSPRRGQFFQRLYAAGNQRGLEFYHWGDLDLGGMRIYQRLKTQAIPELKPYLMDKDALLSKKKYWQPFNEKYGKELEKLLSDPDYQEFFEVITIMLKERVRLEQEAFLLV